MGRGRLQNRKPSQGGVGQRHVKKYSMETIIDNKIMGLSLRKNKTPKKPKLLTQRKKLKLNEIANKGEFKTAGMGIGYGGEK